MIHRTDYKKGHLAANPGVLPGNGNSKANMSSTIETPRGEWFDVDGFIIDTRIWTPAIAQQIARTEGLGLLGAQHWMIIEHVRRHYFQFGSLPIMRLVCRAAGLDPHEAHEYFGSCRSLWRIAGLPNPGEEAMAYMD